MKLRRKPKIQLITLICYFLKHNFWIKLAFLQVFLTKKTTAIVCIKSNTRKSWRRKKLKIDFILHRQSIKRLFSERDNTRTFQNPCITHYKKGKKNRCGRVLITTRAFFKTPSSHLEMIRKLNVSNSLLILCSSIKKFIERCKFASTNHGIWLTSIIKLIAG